MVRVALICQLILESILQIHPKRHLLSVDEKTSIQALERREGVAPDSKKRCQRKEFEYKRHGTTCLIAAIAVQNGQLCQQRIHPTRTEVDFVQFIEQTVNAFPQEDEIIILADQLNIHMSASLVQWVAEKINYQEELGGKGKDGILKNKASRIAFLENDKHRIRFVFTPKHCSWLNPIENWFAKLQRHVITNGNFKSVNELEGKIDAYIQYYNKALLKPIKWKFVGFIKAQMLKNLNTQ